MTETRFSRRAVLGGMAALPLVTTARADTTWPTRPVHVIVPYPPAGGADTTARILFNKISEQLHQQFVVENRGGAGGTIGEAVVAKAEPDGYTVLHDATGFSVNGSLYSTLSFDYRKDFAPVFLASLVPNILVVTPSVPVKTAADVIAYAKAQRDGIDMASSGNGTLQHLCLELFKRAANIKINHVPYRGGGPALTDVMGGRSNSSSPTVRRWSARSRAARSRRSRIPARAGLAAYPTSRLCPIRCPASKRTNGMACSRRTARLRTLCRNSTRRRTRR